MFAKPNKTTQKEQTLKGIDRQRTILSSVQYVPI